MDYATPQDEILARIFGGARRVEGVYFTDTQVRALLRAYGYEFDEDIHADLQEALEADFYRTGGQRNMFRRVQHDGLRLMAAISPFIEEGEDPVKLVLKALVSLGFDVTVDPEWFADD